MPYDPRLSARPGAITTAPEKGLQPLEYGSRRDSHFYVPPQYDPARLWPLALLLHGAGGHAHQGIELLRHLADDAGMILVAPASTGHTWDIIVNDSYGPDVELVDQSLAHVFNRYSIDPAHVAIGGFSDGASYALTLGIANGDLFTHAIAFSPGFIAPAQAHGKPRVFVSHGTHDHVLPLAATSARLVPRLVQAGYEVLYREFDGGHEVPPAIADEAVGWFLRRDASPGRAPAGNAMT